MEACITQLLTPAFQEPPSDSALAKPPPAEEKKKGQSPCRRLLEVFVIVLQDHPFSIDEEIDCFYNSRAT
jgi:hypothetical protein